MVPPTVECYVVPTVIFDGDAALSLLGCPLRRNSHSGSESPCMITVTDCYVDVAVATGRPRASVGIRNAALDWVFV
jgi:hypothetical protein